MNASFWAGRRVFLTGHTGFKGSWLSQWLKQCGARVTGFSLPPSTEPSLFRTASVADGMRSITGDVRDREALAAAIREARPEIVIHMAAQALVRASYDDPVETFETNVMGTVNLLESIRSCGSVRVAVVVTSDKCYANRDGSRPFREEDPLGGRDPYSSSKGCSELVVASYRESFFGAPDSARIFSARAGNVIGGGDWARDRLVPDLVRAFSAGRPAIIRNPDATRPWQFVMDALHGYLLLAEAGWESRPLPPEWNFGPSPEDVRPVRWMADSFVTHWGDGASWVTAGGEQPHEEKTLALDSSRARTLLDWRPRLDSDTAVSWTADGYRSRGPFVPGQIEKYSRLVSA